MQRHAYLLLIHEDTKVLRYLLKLIDDNRNDIYIHVDKRVKNINVKEIEDSIKASHLFWVKRHKVYWGTNSITIAEIELLKAAIKQKYAYYHLLSGADLPIKTQDEIHSFFTRNAGKEFIHFGTNQYQEDIASRYNQYHFFTKQLGRKRDKKFWRDLEMYSLAIQRKLKIDRRKKCSFFFYGGSNWVSITDGMAKEVISQFRKYRNCWRFVQISDELIYQTVIMNSKFKENLFICDFSDDYNACVRQIDWKRGNPYIWKIEDLEELMNSSCVFARKFDTRVDEEIVELLYNKLKKEKNY